MNLILIHSFIFFAFVVYFYRKNLETARLKALYELYDVRDRLVYLVASEVTEEDNKLFSYYYVRVNAFLRLAPNVGLEVLLRNLSKNSDSVEESIAKAEKELKLILSDDIMNNDEVKQIIIDYYTGVRTLILCHSSVFKIGYLLAERFNPFQIAIEYIIKNLPIPKVYSSAYRVTSFVEKEADYIRTHKWGRKAPKLKHCT